MWLHRRVKEEKRQEPKTKTSITKEYKEEFKYSYLSNSIAENKFLVALLLRLFSCLLTKTYFVPDEYWQSTEVAHYNTFNYGYVTWEWKEKIRSYLYPFIFEVYFRVLKHFSIDWILCIMYGPHILQAVLTAYADVSVYHISMKVNKNKQIAIYSFILNLLSWFMFYTGSRTLSNVAEMCFSSIGISYFPLNKSSVNKQNNENSISVSLLFGGIACIIRPTCLLIWIPLVLTSVINRSIGLADLIISCMKVLLPLLILCFGVDFYFYKTFTIVHLNFVQFNIFQNIGVFYGSHPFHWYFTQGLPTILTVHLLFVVVGASQLKSSTLLWIAGLFVFIHSIIPHKEFRFLLPLFPIFMCYAGNGMKCCLQYVNEKRLILFTLLLNVPLAVYFSTIHQRGTISVVHYLSDVVNSQDSILFLTPCHATPYYSYFHQNISMRFLTCEPKQFPGYVCESDQFFTHPTKWLKEEEEQHDFNISSWSYVVMYSNLSPVLKEYLGEYRYKLIVVQEMIDSHHYLQGNVHIPHTLS